VVSIAFAMQNQSSPLLLAKLLGAICRVPAAPQAPRQTSIRELGGALAVPISRREGLIVSIGRSRREFVGGICWGDIKWYWATRRMRLPQLRSELIFKPANIA
jgi:hypothetical protein